MLVLQPHFRAVQELTVLLVSLLIFSSSSSKATMLSLQERSKLLCHLLTSLFTSSTPPTSSPTNHDAVRTHLERRLPAFACQSPDSKAALVRALVPAARHVLNANQCYVSSASPTSSSGGVATSATRAAAVATTGADAAKSLVHCVLGLLLLPLAPGSSSSSAVPAAGTSQQPDSRAASSVHDGENPIVSNDTQSKNRQDDDAQDGEEEKNQGGEGATPEAPQGGLEGRAKNAPEAWVYKLLLLGLEEAAVCSEVIKTHKLEKYIKQLLKSLRAESVPLHALSVPQACKLQVCCILLSPMCTPHHVDCMYCTSCVLVQHSQ